MLTTTQMNKRNRIWRIEEKRSHQQHPSWASLIGCNHQRFSFCSIRCSRPSTKCFTCVRRCSTSEFPRFANSIPFRYEECKRTVEHIARCKRVDYMRNLWGSQPVHVILTTSV
jgi:hypothetical protein